jgi:VanZ family protein
VVGLTFRSVSWWRLTLYLLLAATTIELLQIFVITQSAGLLDGLANAAGIGAGLLLLYGMFAVRQRITAA